jgi:hypothetical protein
MTFGNLRLGTRHADAENTWRFFAINVRIGISIPVCVRIGIGIPVCVRIGIHVSVRIGAGINIILYGIVIRKVAARGVQQNDAQAWRCAHNS